MGFHFVFNDVPVSCDSAEELAEFLGLAGKSGRPQSPDARAVPVNGATVEHKQLRIAQQALWFLNSVRTAGERGIGGAPLIAKIGCNGAAGLGTVVQFANRFLMEANLNFPEVAVKKRSGDDKIWVPGKKIDAGVEALTRKVEEFAATEE